ncbi:MAG: hypothetical protein R3C05_17040 [Pirellulaceae bacterium]
MSFENSSCVFNVDKPLSKYVQRIPILVSPPIELDEIEVSGTGAFEGLTSRLYRDQEKVWLEITIEHREAFPSDIAGTILMRHAELGRVTQIGCVIQRIAPVSVRPTILQLRHDKGTETYIGKAFVRVVPDFFQNQEATNIEAPIIAEAMFNGQVLDVGLGQYGAHLLKVDIRIPMEVVPAERPDREIR